MSALPPKADIRQCYSNVRFVPIAAIAASLCDGRFGHYPPVKRALLAAGITGPGSFEDVFCRK